MNKKELLEVIEEEKALYIPSNYLFQQFTHQKRYLIWKYLKYFRLAQYYKTIPSIIGKLAYRYYLRKKNIYGEKAGIEITNSSKLGRRIDIWHGNVIINASLGDDCIIHGNNVLGNKGKNRENETPILGKGVDVGVGAIVIGDVKIADQCIIGSNAVVTRSCEIPNSILVGIPAIRKE